MTVYDIKTGEPIDANESYAMRLIEHGKAVLKSAAEPDGGAALSQSAGDAAQTTPEGEPAGGADAPGSPERGDAAPKAAKPEKKGGKRGKE